LADNSRQRQKKALRFVAASLLLLLVLVAADFVDTALLAPANTLPPAGDRSARTLRGVIHVHSLYSDGSGTVGEIAAAAAKADLEFVILTDHNTLQPVADGRPGWYGKVLVLFGTELSTQWGHLLYIPLDSTASPQTGPLPRNIYADLIADPNALRFVAHPFHPRMRWRHRPLPAVTGIEIVNADSEWRNDGFGELLGTAVALPFFPWAFNRLLDRPAANLALWDSLLAERPTVGIGSVDAHARIRLGRDRFWKFPSYRSAFKIVQLYVSLSRPLADDFVTARRQVLEALGQGHAYVGFGLVGDPRGFEFIARAGDRRYAEGDSVTADRVDLSVRVPAGAAVEIRLLIEGKLMASARASELSYVATKRGAYRVEVYQLRRRLPLLRRKAVPWIFSNPIYVQVK